MLLGGAVTSLCSYQGQVFVISVSCVAFSGFKLMKSTTDIVIVIWLIAIYILCAYNAL